MVILNELDSAKYWAGSQGEGLRNIVNDPEYTENQNKELYAACMEMKERLRKQAIYEIQKQPFYA